ncbi:hypothetical protein [Halorussus sp. MSC15.2]|uniref:hypothetical protein n=1 Tax=Halorussus sp. MSC15.2 TaxID=2283638 RepID=UPI0013D5D155|nr:hypothetical protein [Halorussus sp. MSC15.2]NEU55852.1 hypothetical protein [Halorussus sp. MSC15.2]
MPVEKAPQRRWRVVVRTDRLPAPVPPRVEHFQALVGVDPEPERTVGHRLGDCGVG